MANKKDQEGMDDLREQISDLKEQIEEQKLWQINKDFCMHTARILIGFVWIGLSTTAAALYYTWDWLKGFLHGVTR